MISPTKKRTARHVIQLTSRRFGWYLGWLAIAALFGVLLFWFSRPVSRVALLNYQLERAIATDDTRGAIAAINAGADPNTTRYLTCPPFKIYKSQIRNQRLQQGCPLYLNYLWPERNKGWMPDDEKAAVLTALLDHGADPNATSGGRPAISLAVEYNLNESVRLLVRHRADVNAPDGTGATPLVYAVESGNVTAIDILVAANARLSDSYSGNSTLLMLSVESKQLDSVRRLLATHPRLNDADYYGKTALDYSLSLGQPRITQMLRSAGAGTGVQRKGYSVRKEASAN